MRHEGSLTVDDRPPLSFIIIEKIYSRVRTGLNEIFFHHNTNIDKNTMTLNGFTFCDNYKIILVGRIVRGETYVQ